MKKPSVAKIENKEAVSKIIMFPTAIVKCQIGQDWYKCQFEVTFVPRDCYPDYIEVNEFVKEEIDGQELNIEQAAKILRDFLVENYAPEEIEVCNHIKGCKTHFDVDVFVKGGF